MIAVSNKNQRHGLKIIAATEIDLQDIALLLKSNDLPSFGLQEHISTTVLIKRDDKLIACSSLELYGKVGLLRSVAVNKSDQGTGHGSEVVNATITLAIKKGIKKLYLLTAIARKYFEKSGFAVVNRKDVDKQVLKSSEFTLSCCLDAIVMLKNLNRPKRIDRA